MVLFFSVRGEGKCEIKCKARSLGIMCRKNGVCVGRCMCTRIHGGKR